MKLSKDKRFYVYEWFDVDTGHVFYVGKGTENRYKNKEKSRNDKFLNYLNSHNCDVRIVKDGLTEKEALGFEADYGLSKLAVNEAECSSVWNLGFGTKWKEEIFTILANDWPDYNIFDDGYCCDWRRYYEITKFNEYATKYNIPGYRLWMSVEYMAPNKEDMKRIMNSNNLIELQKEMKLTCLGFWEGYAKGIIKYVNTHTWKHSLERFNVSDEKLRKFVSEWEDANKRPWE